MAYEIGDDIFRFPRYSQDLERNLCRASFDEIHDIQSRRLRPILKYCWDHMPFYRRLWEEAGVSPDDVRAPEDLVKLPTWDKDVQRREIENAPPYGTYYVDRDVRNISHLLTSGGTTGTPRIFPIMKSDLSGLQDILCRTVQSLGVGERDIVHTSSHYSAFAGAWCATWAIEGAGAAITPAGSGRSLPSERQVDLIHRTGTTVLRMQASYAEKLAETAINMGLDPALMNVRTIIIAGETYSKERRARIERYWNAKAYDFFGSSDTFSWTSVDCEHSQSMLGEPGMHVWEDSCVIEVLDEDQKPCPPGVPGELTFTTFNWRNSPRIRYRTGDLVAVHRDRCACGRNLARMSPVLGRVDQVVRFRALNIYPTALESVIFGADSNIRQFLAVAKTEDNRDILEVSVEWPNLDDRDIVQKVKSAISTKLGASADVKLVERGSTEHRTGVGGSRVKCQRLFDDRH
jgi:phenylacetate-CoA ligase